MKRLLGIFILSFCINSCDDGEFEIQSFDFSSIPAAKCEGANNSFFIYYTNDREALFLEIPASSFPNTITQPSVPRPVTINAANKVTYRVYNGNVTAASICSTIPPVTPIPVEEWIATSGVIEIITSVNRQTNETTGQSFITGYTHTIKLVNALFVKGDGNQQLFEELFLGDYVTSVAPPTISPSSPIYNCVNNLNYIFQNSGKEVITLNTVVNLFVNDITPTGQPRTAVIDGAGTKMAYKVYAADVDFPNTFFCVTPEPATTVPPLLKTWIALNGSTANQTGIIEVTSVLFNPTTYRHTISLRKVTFAVDGVDFTFGDLYVLGTIDTQL
jgi:hypothetical protein